jgi:TolB-like protein/Flp pilus assembly protein TadD
VNRNPERKSLLGQFFERKVMRVGLAYILVGWILMQIGEVTFEALQLPAWALSLLIVIVLLGFPIALILAWAYEVTPEGIVRDPKDSERSGRNYSNSQNSLPSVAVLPFDDMSEAGDQLYFCEGIAEEILNALCKVSNLHVASRVASFQYSGKRADITEIGSKLHVQTVLEGSVRQFGDQLRITVQLVDTMSGFHLWTRQYDRRKEDLFEIQEDIAEHIAGALSVTLSRSHFREQSQVDPKAYDYFLRGKYYFSKCNAVDSAYARQMFQKAIDVDPDYGRAWAWLAYTFGFEYMYFDANIASRDEALRISEKALVKAPNLAETHIAAGVVLCMTGDCENAESEFLKAIDIEPNNYEAWYFFGRAKIHEGNPKKALKLLQQATKIRPEDYQSVLLQAQLYVSLHSDKKAKRASRKGVMRARNSLEFNPDDNRALNLGALALQRLGEHKQAAQWMQGSLDKAPDDPVVLYNSACFYTMTGDTDRALDSLQKSLNRVGSINLKWLENDSDLSGLRDHPRYVELVEGLPEGTPE